MAPDVFTALSTFQYVVLPFKNLHRTGIVNLRPNYTSFMRDLTVLRLNAPRGGL